MNARQAFLIVIAVQSYVVSVLLTETYHHLVDIFHASIAFAHRLGGEICVTARAIPIREKLRGERDRNFEVFGNALEDVTRDPKLVTD